MISPPALLASPGPPDSLTPSAPATQVLLLLKEANQFTSAPRLLLFPLLGAFSSSLCSERTLEPMRGSSCMLLSLKSISFLCRMSYYLKLSGLCMGYLCPSTPYSQCHHGRELVTGQQAVSPSLARCLAHSGGGMKAGDTENKVVSTHSMSGK